MKLRPNRKSGDSLYQYVSKRYNISQLARDTDLTRPTIIAILNGDTKKPGHEKLNALAELLEMEWDYDEEGLFFTVKNLDTALQVNENTNPYGLRKDQLELLEKLDNSDAQTQEMIWSIIHTIIDARKQNK